MLARDGICLVLNSGGVKLEGHATYHASVAIDFLLLIHKKVFTMRGHRVLHQRPFYQPGVHSTLKLIITRVL